MSRIEGGGATQLAKRVKVAEAQVDKIVKRATCVEVELAAASERVRVLTDRVQADKAGFDVALTKTCAARYRAEHAELQRAWMSEHRDKVMITFHSIVSSLAQGPLSKKLMDSISLITTPVKLEMITDRSSSPSTLPHTPTQSASKNVFLAAVAAAQKEEKVGKAAAAAQKEVGCFSHALVSGDTPMKHADKTRQRGPEVSVGDVIGSDELFEKWLARDFQVSAATPEGLGRRKQMAKAKSQKQLI